MRRREPMGERMYVMRLANPSPRPFPPQDAPSVHRRPHAGHADHRHQPIRAKPRTAAAFTDRSEAVSNAPRQSRSASESVALRVDNENDEDDDDEAKLRQSNPCEHRHSLRVRFESNPSRDPLMPTNTRLAHTRWIVVISDRAADISKIGRGRPPWTH